MKWLNKKRASGKTTGLIFTSEATGYPIVVETPAQARIIKEKAIKMGVKIPEPMSAKDYLDNSRGRHFEKILIDESSRIIETALESYFNTKIAAITMSLEDMQ